MDTYISPEIFQNIAFLLVGILVGLWTSHYFAAKSSCELQKIGQAFAGVAEQHGLVEWTRDAMGQITYGRILSMTGSATSGPAKVTGVGETIRK